MPTNSARWPARKVAAVLLLLTLGAVLVRGYHPYAEDAEIYLPGIEKLLNPQQFFRLNRSEIVNLNFIENLKPDFKDRLVVYLRNPKIKLVSSVSRAPHLRSWLDSQ